MYVSSYAEAPTQPFFEDPPPLFNGLADRYFSTHGFQASMLHTIAQVLQECDGNSDTFIQFLTDRGTAHTEAEWIWEILTWFYSFFNVFFFFYIFSIMQCL